MPAARPGVPWMQQTRAGMCMASNCAQARPHEAIFETRVSRAGNDALVARSRQQYKDGFDDCGGTFRVV